MATHLDNHFSRLKEALDACGDPEKIAQLVRATLKKFSAEEIPLSGCDDVPLGRFTLEQEKLLVSAASSVLDQELKDLLEEMKLTEVASVLVCNYIGDLNTAACAISSQCLAPKLDFIVNNRLLGKLETRGKILDVLEISKDCSWFNQLCAKLPTERALKQQTWAFVKQSMEGLEGTPTAMQEQAVWTVWSKGHNLRQIIQRFGLSPEFADAATSIGLETVQNMSKQDLELLQRGQSATDRGKLLRLWRHESEAGRAESKHGLNQRKTFRDNIKQASETVLLMKNGLIANRTDSLVNLSIALSKVTSELGLGEWNTNVNDSELEKSLNDLGVVLEDATRELAAVAEEHSVTDESVISRVSAGSALCGVPMGLSAAGSGQYPTRPLLSIPQSCQLLSPSIGVSTKVITFTSISAAAKFRTTVTFAGERITASLAASGWGQSVEVGGSKGTEEKNKREEKECEVVNSAARMTYGVVPVKAFRVEREQMVLSPDAENTLLGIYDLESARRFLVDFGSHIPCGVQHLGGIFWKIVEIQAVEQVKMTTMEAALANESNGILSASIGSWGMSVSGSVACGKFGTSANETEKSKSSNSYTAMSRTECTGPNVTNFEMFSRILAADSSSWFLIDRGLPTELVPVWELIDDMPDSEADGLVRIKTLLRDAWLDSAQHLQFVPELKDLISRARQGRFAKVNGHCNEYNARKLVVKEVETVCSLVVPKTGGFQLRQCVEHMFEELDRFYNQFDTFLLAEMLRDISLPAFLRSIALNSTEENVKPTLSFLAMKLDTSTRRALAWADPPVILGNEIQAALEKLLPSSSLTIKQSRNRWYPPRVECMKDLPGTIRRAVSDLNGETDLLTERVGAILSTSLWKHQGKKSSKKGKDLNLCDQLLEVVEAYGCSQNGFISPLKRGSYDALLEAIDLKINPISRPRGIYTTLPITVADPVFPGVVATHHGHPYCYIRTDRPASEIHGDLSKKVLHAFIHRLDLHSTLYQIPESESRGVGDDSKKRTAKYTRAAKSGRRTSVPTTAAKAESVFDATVELFRSIDVAARSEMHRLLLDRRLLTPFVLPSGEKFAKASFSCDIAALSLVNTVVEHDIHAVIGNLTSDTLHLRVALLSERSNSSSSAKLWIKSVFHVNSLHAMDYEEKAKMTKSPTAAEIGWGFLCTGGDKFVPVVLIHVIGDYRPLREMIESFCDAVVVDVGNSDSVDIKLNNGCLIKWKHADFDEESDDDRAQDDCDDEDETSVAMTDGDVEDIVWLRCPFPMSNSEITEVLLEEIDLLSKRKNRVPLASAVWNELNVIKIQSLNFARITAGLNFSSVRSELQMQLAFAKESQESLFYQRENNPANAADQATSHSKFQESRKNSAIKSDRHPLLRLFREILKTESPSDRVIRVLDLERFLSERCEEQNRTAHQKYRQARDAWHDDPNPTNCKALTRSLDDWDMQNLQLEHLWREIAQLYVLSPDKQEYLTKLAAQHLLDGFALELMDGDAGIVNLRWVRGVLKALANTLSRSKIFVLSVMGVQSSGKSTLLNYMFGVRLRTSVSRCTRGVSMQLLKCDGRSEYDYIVLMDTEGIRASERIGAEGSVWMDNRMATFSILPADATIILTKGESTVTINEILPIVVSAYLESEVAQHNQGQLPSTLLFVFNQVDLAEKSKLENVVDTLRKELRANAEKVSEIRHGQHLHNDESERKGPAKSYRGANIFDDLNFDVTDEKNSDVRVLGTIKAQPYPPHDSPLPDYGERLLQLRELIHRRVCGSKQNWKGRTIDEFSDYISIVWDCIERSNFHLNFVAAFERINYDKLISKVNEYAELLTTKYCTAFEGISKDISKRSDDSTQDEPAALTEEFSDQLDAAVITDVNTLDAKMKEVLSEECFSKWGIDQQNRWTRHKEDQDVHWKKLVKDQVDNDFLYEKYVDVYKAELRADANILFGDGKYITFDEHQKRDAFDVIFQRIIDKASYEHPQAHRKVAGNVEKIFRESHIWVLNGPNQKRSNRFWLFDWSKREDLELKEAKLWSVLFNNIKQILAPVKQYNNAIVWKCIKHATSTLVKAEDKMTVSTEFKERTYREIKDLLCDRLTEIQQRWDRKNCVTARFVASEGEMKTYFDNLGKGYQGLDLLRETVCDWLKRNVRDSFLEELVYSVGTTLKAKRWVADADVMQALVDSSLVELIDKNLINWVIYKIRNPKNHIHEIISSIIQNEVRECTSKMIKKYLRILDDSIKKSALKAAESHQDRAIHFLSCLKSELRVQLPTGATNCLLTKIPQANDSNINCDHQPDVFREGDNDYVCTPMLATLDKVMERVAREEEIDVTKKVLEFIKSRTSEAGSDGVRPRCGQPCPLCRCPCTRELGHVGSDDEKKRHDTYHQPSGLAYMTDVTTKEISPGSCYTNTVNRLRFRQSEDDEWHPYSEFDQVFPNWSQPVQKSPLQLREYVFYNYQAELIAGKSNHKQCTSIPIEYNHSLSDIKEDIARKLGYS